MIGKVREEHRAASGGIGRQPGSGPGGDADGLAGLDPVEEERVGPVEDDEVDGLFELSGQPYEVRMAHRQQAGVAASRAAELERGWPEPGPRRARALLPEGG